MFTVPDPRCSVSPVVRHGSCRLLVHINGTAYSLARFATATPAWRLTKQSPDDQPASYIAAVNEHGLPACSCPDHQVRGAQCKHLGALLAAGLLPAPVPKARSRKRRSRRAPAQAVKS